MKALSDLLFSLTPCLLLLVVAVFWTYSKGRVRKPYRWLITIALALLPIGLYAYIILNIFFVHTYDFSTERWNENKEERWRMAEDIVDSKILIGKYSNQVKILLGQPEQKNDSLHIWSYDMGQGGGGLGFRFHTLIVRYQNGVVTKVEHNSFDD